MVTCRKQLTLKGLWTLATALLCTLALASPGGAYGIDAGQPLSQLRLDTWSVRDGLPSRVINAIAQTPDGFIWLATSAGLIRFDGVSFDTYNTDNTPSLPANTITVLTVTRDGTLWVGTEWGGFGRFIDGKFIPSVPPDKHWSKVDSIVEDSDGSVWVGGWGDAPVRHVVDNRVIPFTNLQTPDPGVNALLPLGNGKVLCGMPWDSPKELSSNGKVTKVWANLKFNETCSCLAHGHNGAIWWGNSQDGLWEIKDGHIRHFTTQNGLSSNDIASVYCDHSGYIWIGTTNGLSVWDGSHFQSFGKPDGLYDAAVGPMLNDMEGNFWVGAGVGLNRFAPTKLCPITLTRGGEAATLPGQNSLSRAPHGGMWCATNEGLWFLQNRTQAYCDLGTHLDSHLEGVMHSTDGNLWIWDNFINKAYDLVCVSPGATGESVEDAFMKGRSNTLEYRSLNLTTSIFSAVPIKGGLIGFSKGKAFYFVPGKLVSTKNFPGTFQFTARQDRKGTIWVGDEKGLIRWKDGKATVFDDGLPKDTHVLSIDVTDPDRLWLATDHGLAMFQNGHSTMFGKEAGLPDTNLFEIIRDGHDRLWFGSNYGIFNIRIQDIVNYSRHLIKTIPFFSFAASDGIRSFPTTFITQQSADGKLWFGGDKGITVADPNISAINPIPPPVSIEAGKLDKVTLTLNGANKVPPGSGLFTVRYAALSFAATEKVQFRYKLEGLDDHWTDSGTRRMAMYPYLPPGHYRFVVMACNNDGVWSQKAASMSFVLEPHYYQTTWFKLLCAAAFLVLLGFIYWIRVRSMVFRNRELAVKVSEHTAQLQISNEQLQAAQDTLESQYSLLEDRNHELEAMHRELEAQNVELLKTQDSLAEANAHLAALATTDGLTGLKNHRSFQEELESEWERHHRYKSPLSLILLDIDLFKQYNDSFGHQAGDGILKNVAEVLSKEARECDVVARYGGEEFVIILPETDVAGAKSLAGRICSAIEAAQWPLRPVTASFGVATVDSSILSGADLFTHADSALFHSKELGRNRVTHSSDLPGNKLRKAG
jgi:diguanylate cyclase (GGDEF)-like protein